jgi:hypothetical protein
MSTGLIPNGTPALEVVDSPEVLREKAGVDRTVQLQIEYRKKLRGLARRHRELSQQSDESPISSAFSPAAQLQRRRLSDDRTKLLRRLRLVEAAANELARYASGLIEGSRIPQIDKVELRLRNAELEAELSETRTLLN